MSAVLNLGSLLLGVIAWAIPLFNLIRRDKANHRRWAALSIASVGACAAALCLQLIEVSHRVENQDWAALMDTSEAVTAVAGLLLVVTITLNAIVAAVYYRVSHGKHKG